MKKKEVLNFCDDVAKYYYIDGEELSIRAMDLDRVLREYVDNDEEPWYKKWFK